MKVLAAASLAACGGGVPVPVQIPKDAVLSFAVHATEDTPPIECSGRIFMATLTVQYTCWDSRFDPALIEDVTATVEYIQRPDEAWLHFLALPGEKSHYPTYNGVTMAIGLRPNHEGTGWEGDALVYERDQFFGYPDLYVTAYRV
jgi:hypothetical protein